MLSLKEWLGLFVFYLLYLLVGGFLFKAIEAPNELEICRNQGKNTTVFFSTVDPQDDCKDPKDWNFYNSLFFSFTVMSTIGKFHNQTTATSLWI